MNCSSCSRPVVAERNYCGGCGAALARFCVHCGFRNHISDGFCGGCGATLGDSGAAGTPFHLARPPFAAPATPSFAPTAADDLAELLAAAEEGDKPGVSDPTARVSQDDIDSLFGD